MTVDTTAQVLTTARWLFAEKGYDGVSVREICSAAGVSANAVHYHFGSKNGLYQDILRGFVTGRLAAANRMLAGAAEGLEDLRIRLELFCEETLVAFLSEREVLVIALNEMGQGFERGGDEIAGVIGEHEQLLAGFLEDAQRRGLLRDDVDVAIVAGTLLERLSTQVRYIEFHKQLWGATQDDAEYRHHWVRQVVEICLFGAVASSGQNERRKT